MSDDAIKVPIEGDAAKMDALVQGIGRVEQALLRLVAAQDSAVVSTTQSGVSIDAAIAALNRWYDRQAAGAQTVAGWAAALERGVESVSELAAEQEHLDQQSAALRLNFDEGAAAAGRFADETDAMRIAGEFAARQANLSQQQLDGLFRLASARSADLGVTAGEAAGRLAEALLKGKERGLDPFGQSLGAVAGETHTLGERLDAMVAEANRVTPAVDDARDAVERWKDSLDDAKRAGADAFVSEFTRITEAGAAIRSTRGDVVDLATTFRALGATVGEVAARIVGGLRVVGNTALLVVHTVGDVLGIDGEERAAMETAADLDASVDAVTAEADAAEAPLTSSGTETRDPVRRQRPRGQRELSGAGAAAAARAAEQRRRAFQQLLGRAFQSSGGINALGASERLGLLDTATRPAGEDEGDAGAKESAQRRTEEAAFASSTDGRRLAETRERDAARTQRLRDQELARLRSFTEHWEDLHHRQVTAAELAAEAGTMGLEKFGAALGKHAELLAQQKESVGDAARGMVAEVLSSIGHEAIVKGAMEEAEGFASLANPFTAALAPAHFLAGTAFLAAGSLASALGGAATPAAPTGRGGSSSGGSSASAGGAPRSASGRFEGDRLSSGRPTRDADASAPIVYQITYNAPVFGGRSGSDADVGEAVHQYDLARQARLRRAA